MHLSYPFVLEHEGEVWMVPETSAAGTIELYRAEAFPHRWTREAVLVEGVEASDATLVQHDGRWWMLATVRHGGSFSDTLTAWSAERLTGPSSSNPTTEMTPRPTRWSKSSTNSQVSAPCTTGKGSA